jgi:hypothetical protein
MRIPSPFTARHFVQAFLVAFVLVLLPGLLFGQVDTTAAEPAQGSNAALTAALAAAAVIAAGYAAKLIYDGIKTTFPWYDRLPALVHQILAPIWGFLFGAVTSATGAELLTDIHAINAAWIGGILVTGIQAGFKRLEKAKNPTDATVALEASRASQPGSAKAGVNYPPRG